MKIVKFHKYSKNYPNDYQNMKEKIVKCLGNIDIHHIGSTSVPDLGGKGVIDILIGVDNWNDINLTIKNLKAIGFTHVHPKEKGRVFLSTKKENSGISDFHIHIVKIDTKQYNEILKFRNILRQNSNLKQDYENLKSELVISVNSNREKYKEIKEKYICKILKKMEQ